ncbi:MAG: helix-turn-helix transcriptional regulator [Halanaerobium sp.]|nr:helix-turn-helix transcriptional regulator [Halanaerobium sp.]
MSLKYAILGLLNIAPMTGYAIKKNFSGPMGAFWYVSFGGLYPALHRLAADGLIDFVEKDDGRRQKEYFLTAKGRNELEDWFSMETPSPQTRDEFMLKIFLSTDLDDRKRLKLIGDYLNYKEGLQREIEKKATAMEKGEVASHKGIEFVTEYSLNTLRQEINILQKMYNRMQKEVER